VYDFAVSAASEPRAEEGEAPMKRLLALVAAIGLAVGLYAATATGGQQAVTPAQFAALKKQVTTLQKDVKRLKTQIACISVAGAAEFGSDTAGYHYKQPDGSEVLTTALDFVGQGETPAFYIATVDKACVQASFHFARVPAARRSSE
jgi:uncharacterized protein HemX